ncbi:MAG: serine/threonine protein kinase [Kofleriaceae bacterium]
MSGIPAGAGSLLGKRLGKYEILALLALGGTAEIYLARIAGAAGFEKYVVVKCLHDHLTDDQEFVKMFLDEARLAAHLDHSNIVQTMDFGEYENRYYMVMEFLAGLSLAMVVRRAAERLPGGRVPAPLILNIVAQACAGLHYAHERSVNGRQLNIVHRDISPQNLVISFEGVVKVVDFGIAKAEMRETRTRSGTIKGKFAYMSPEQCVANNVDRRTDVFALGVVAHELLSGRRLFKRDSPYDTYQAVIECAADPPSKVNHELDPAIDALIMRAIAKDKEARYLTAEAFGDAIVSYLHHRGKGSGSSDLARFFDASFGPEIEEHGARMRELISGREFSADTGVTWGEDPVVKPVETGETVDLAGRAQTIVTAEPDDMASTNDRSLSGSGSLEGLGDPITGDDDLPADKTRIEANPMEKLEELNRAAQLRPETVSGALPLPAPPTGPLAVGLPTVVVGPDVMQPSPPTRESRPTMQGVYAAASSHTTQTVPPAIALGPGGYPVMNAQMSAQMIGGSVYPSEPVRTAASPDPRLTPSGPQLAQAANVASPVGPQYPQVDWGTAAAMPARALPPWMLGVLFVAAIGVALGITLLISLLF